MSESVVQLSLFNSSEIETKITSLRRRMWLCISIAIVLFVLGMIVVLNEPHSASGDRNIWYVFVELIFMVGGFMIAVLGIEASNSRKHWLRKRNGIDD